MGAVDRSARTGLAEGTIATIRTPTRPRTRRSSRSARLRKGRATGGSPMRTLYVTLEPCSMCAGAIVLCRIPRVVFGAHDPKAGMGGSLENLLQDDRLNHRCELTAGVMADEASEMLKAFFRARR